MLTMPDFLPAILAPLWARLLTWFSDQVYQRLLKADDWLVELKAHLDFRQLEEVCAAYHHASGPGAPPLHPAPRLVRALVVKYLYDLSFRELEWAIRTNLTIRWFVGYTLFERVPDHTTLERFEQWVYEQQHYLFFDEVIRQIDRDFPEERTKPQVGDTFAMRANAAPESLIRLLRHAARCLRRTLAQVDPDGSVWLESQLDREGLDGIEGEPKEYRLDQTQRRARLERTVQAVVHCLDLVRTRLQQVATLSDADRQAVTLWLHHLDKILADELQITQAEQPSPGRVGPGGQVIAVQELPKEKKGSYRIASATDPDATFRVHGDQIDFGYNVNVAATDTFIREIRADTGAQPDPVAIPDLLAAQQERHGVLPPKFVYDQAAGTGKTHAEVDQATHGQTQLVAPLIDYRQRSERLGPDDFALSPDGQTLTCPHGQVSTTAYRSQSGEGRVFRFTARQCAGCPLTPLCRGEQVPPDHIRQVFISDHRSTLAQARTYAQTPAYKADLKLRPPIERIIANLTRYHGARRARGRGLSRADYQARMNAMAFNLREWLRQLDRRHRPPPRLEAVAA